MGVCCALDPVFQRVFEEVVDVVEEIVGGWWFFFRRWLRRRLLGRLFVPACESNRKRNGIAWLMLLSFLRQLLRPLYGLVLLRDDLLLLLQELVLNRHLLDPPLIQLVLLAQTLQILLPVAIPVLFLPRLRLSLHFALIIEFKLLDSFLIMQDGVLKLHLFFLLLRSLFYVLSLFDRLED